MNRSTWTATLRIATAALILGAAPVSAQTVLGRMVDRGTGAPVAAAVVALVDASGVERSRTLTDEEGRFRLVAPEPGPYTLHGERVGYADSRSEGLLLRAGRTLRYELRANPETISLEGIRVEAERRCRLRPADGMRTARLWEEARKVLRAVAVGQEQQLYRFQLVDYRRELDKETFRVLSEERSRSEGLSTSPFTSRPAATLLEEGFVLVDEDYAMQFFAPDADVLLSESFLDSHCFRAVGSRTDPALVGLAFEPLPGRRVPDVTGTLWLDAESAALKHLEFGYTRLPIATNLAGGRVEFERLPGGPWVVRRWWIRMPRLGIRGESWRGRADRSNRLVVASLHEVGGEILGLLGGRRDLGPPERAVIAGVVFDSTRRAPLAGATVFLDGTGFTSTTDEEGAFRIEDVPDGRYRLGFFHGRADSVGVLPPPVEVTVEAGEAPPVELALSCGDAALDSECREAVRLAREGPEEDEVIPLDPVRVEANASERVMNTARDNFITRPEIEALLPTSNLTTLLMKSRFSLRTRMAPRYEGFDTSLRERCLESSTNRGRGTEPCNPVTIYVNGVEMVDPEGILETLDPNVIASMEFIPSSEGAARFGRRGLNGVLLITTLPGA